MLIVLTALALVTPAPAADASQPHPHQGTLAKFKGKPAIPELTADQVATLGAGKPVVAQERGDKGGRGTAIQDVEATPERVWSRILTFEKYPEWVDNVKTCEIIEKSGPTWTAHFVIGAALFSAEYWIVHDVHPEQGFMTWEMDYSKLNDLDDSVGYWVVQAHPDKPGWSRVFYSVDVKVGGWVPGFVEDIVAKQGLTKATAWVKRESEKQGG